jgi:tetratricopeptide (TPR) repeat protein
MRKPIKKPGANQLPKIWECLEWFTTQAQNYTEAAKCYELAIEKNNTDWIWNYYNGYLNLEMGNPNAVIDNFKRVTELNADANLAWYYLGGGYKNLNNNELAEDSYNKITSVKTRTTSANTTTRQGHFPLGVYAGFETFENLF